MIMPKDDEDTALLFGGKKKNFNKKYFDRFGANLELNDKQVNFVYKRLDKWLLKASELIQLSFLNDDKKASYTALIEKRTQLFLSE
ncbi:MULTISPECIES: hypothetical protein [unclassified Flavobacterium]|uniref:hypothetical protein n=1 Tax=unclassified Flavobacterium TaxID=196869 RepID=UPI003F8E55A0